MIVFNFALAPAILPDGHWEVVANTNTKTVIKSYSNRDAAVEELAHLLHGCGDDLEATIEKGPSKCP